MMRNFNLKKLMGLGLSVFVLSIGSISLTGCEVETQGDAEELGEEIDEATEDVKEEVEN